MLLSGVGPVIAWRRATAANLRRNLARPAAAGRGGGARRVGGGGGPLERARRSTARMRAITSSRLNGLVT